MKLYPFQKVVPDRFVDVPGVLLGDEMGTGKTVEALALDLRRRTTRLDGQQQTANKTLIVSPLTVTSSWVTHIKLMWPGARVALIDPKNRDQMARQLTQPYHYYVVHREAMRLLTELRSVSWYHIIADEAHRAKNRKSQQTLGLKKLRTKYKTACTGTPADNRPQDLWSVLNWLYPRSWSGFWPWYNNHIVIEQHKEGYCFLCSKSHKRSFRKEAGVQNVEEFLEQIQPYYLRRLKTDVLEDLPDKYYTQIDVELTPKQRRIYEQMRQEMLAWIGKHEDEPIAAPIVISQLVRLKQFALAYAETTEVIVRKRECGECEDDGYTTCQGHAQTRIKLSEPSSKLDVVMDKLEDNPTEQFVVFSESKQIINLLAQRLDRAGITHVVLTGDTAQEDRGRLVDEFQSGEARVFAGTIHAGGEGITLTAASTVIFLDRTWNPSRNRQAEDRLHRIGQKNAVEVIDVVATDTVDGGRLQQLELKWSWLKQLLGDEVKDGTRVLPQRGVDGPAGDSVGSKPAPDRLTVA